METDNFINRVNRKENCSSIDSFFTYHSIIRASQRGFNSHTIEMVLEYGTIMYKQGLLFYIFGSKNRDEINDSKLHDRLKNIVVVVSGKDGTILTCYKNNNPFKHIKRKAKELFKTPSN